jgi:hypothetical protein
MALSDEEQAQAYLPSDEDVSFYDRHGYWVAPVIIPDAILTGAERGMTRFYAEGKLPSLQDAAWQRP